MTNKTYDVAVVGAGPAGTVAAIRLARKEYRVLLIDRDRFPRKGATTVWLNTRAAPLMAELGVAAKPLLNRPIKNITLYNADFSKSAKPNFQEAPGYLVDRSTLDATLVKAAVTAGAVFLQGSPAIRLRLQESSLTVELANGRSAESKLLVIATGRDADLVDQAGFARGTAGIVVWSAQVGAPRKAATKAPSEVSVILGLDRRGSFALVAVTPECASVTLNWYGEREEALAALVSVCKAAFAHQIVPADLSSHAPHAPLLRCLAAAALDLDTHAGKHTLLIGDAGGFIAAASNEGLYPAMWSADIAASVVDEALKSRHSQDLLKSFDSAWRMSMADYLRSPNTDPQFLVPLIFSNQPMADRMGAAFFSGENI